MIPEETVRWNAARRLPKRLILPLRNDPHREVRIRIVSLLEDAELAPMLANTTTARPAVARRIAPPLLSRPWVDDPEPEVRKVVVHGRRPNG